MGNGMKKFFWRKQKKLRTIQKEKMEEQNRREGERRQCGKETGMISRWEENVEKRGIGSDGK